MRALAGAPPAVAGAVALAAAALWTIGRTDWGPLLHGGGLGAHEHPGAVAPLLAAAAWLVGWALMVVAMMLPTATGFLGAVQGRGPRAYAAAGLLCVWGLAGVVPLLVLALADASGARLAWIGARPDLAVAAALVLAGAYQATGLKVRSLERCRDHARLREAGPDPSGDALRAGIAQGRSSLGCCWPLMALMVLLGLGGLWWMLAIGAVVAAEACAPRGERLRVPLGVALVLAGLLVLAAGAPPGA